MVAPVAISPLLRRLTAKKEGWTSPVGTVGATAEFKRIAALPRRLLLLDQVEDVTPHVRKPGGTMRLFPVQSAALIEMAIKNGLLGPIAVGHGKELICLLAPVVMDSERTVLLVPPELRAQVQRDMARYGEHFEIPRDRITIVAYSELSLAKNTDLLERLKPDLIVANECHHLKRRQSARTKRILRYFKQHPECRLVALSGTMMSKSIADYAHLSEFALRKNSPVPGNWQEVQDWAGALDVKPPYVMKPGALLKFCAPGESVRDAFGRRLVETPGVVTVQNAELGTALYIRRVGCPVPPVVVEKLDEVRRTWSIDGDEIADAAIRAMVLLEVACGFYYRWAWPGGVIDYEWLGARSAWKKAVREKLVYAREGTDSELLLFQAAERWHRGERSGRVWNCPEWPLWNAVRHRPEPPKETIWLDDYLCRDALDRARAFVKAGHRSIIWVEHIALGERLAKLARLPFYGGGTDAGTATIDILIASRRAQGTGKNLQDRYSANIFPVVCSGKEMEQTIGRTHRTAQVKDEVWVEWYGHLPELEALMNKAIEEAQAERETFKKPQKLLYGTHLEARS